MSAETDTPPAADLLAEFGHDRLMAAIRASVTVYGDAVGVSVQSFLDHLTGSDDAAAPGGDT